MIRKGHVAIVSPNWDTSSELRDYTSSWLSTSLLASFLTASVRCVQIAVGSFGPVGQDDDAGAPSSPSPALASPAGAARRWAGDYNPFVHQGSVVHCHRG